jgi:hypothetical protein
MRAKDSEKRARSPLISRMSLFGQNEKNSVRVHVFRFALNERTRSRGSALRAEPVAAME